MTKNPFPEIIVDESSGVEVPSFPHRIWGSGYSAGFDDCLTAFEKNLNGIENLMDHGATSEQIINKLVEATRAVNSQ
jgi:hypothetical protein